MDNYLWFLIIPIFIVLSIYIKWISDSTKDFFELIDSELKQKGMKLISSTYPGLFKVGPFKKFEISFGKPQIDGFEYEKTYYRIIEVGMKNNKTKKVWAKITTSWFKETKIEFKPKLSEIEK
jgi:hypothetical protein